MGWSECRVGLGICEARRVGIYMVVGQAEQGKTEKIKLCAERVWVRQILWLCNLSSVSDLLLPSINLLLVSTGGIDW